MDGIFPVLGAVNDDVKIGGAGVMVLPVAYTKGLEFDAVLLFDPSERKYPADDSHVKLLYVAATRGESVNSAWMNAYLEDKG